MGTKLVSRGDALEPAYLNNLRVAARSWGIITGLAVSQKGAGADMSVDVAAGDARINGILVSKGSVTNVAVSAAHATYNRYDLVVINSSGTISVQAGTAAATAYAPDYDFEANNAILLAEIYIPATDTAIENAQITDKRVISMLSEIYAHGQAYRTASYTLAASNTWYDLALTGGNNNLVRVSHSTSTNPERISVSVVGVYLVSFHIKVQAQGNFYIARLMKNGSVEIPGSNTQCSATTSTSLQASNAVLVSLAAGDYIVLQVGNNTAGGVIASYDDGTTPDVSAGVCAMVSIIKVG